MKTLISILLPEEKGNVANKKRFNDEYSGSTLFLPKTNPKPDDYNAIFSGNVEDNFKIGFSLTKKTIKVIRTLIAIIVTEYKTNGTVILLAHNMLHFSYSLDSTLQIS